MCQCVELNMSRRLTKLTVYKSSVIQKKSCKLSHVSKPQVSPFNEITNAFLFEQKVHTYKVLI